MILRRRDVDRRYFGGIEKRRPAASPTPVSLILVDSTDDIIEMAAPLSTDRVAFLHEYRILK